MFYVVNTVFTNIATFKYHVMKNVPTKGAVIFHLFSLLFRAHTLVSKVTVEDKYGEFKVYVIIWILTVKKW